MSPGQDFYQRIAAAGEETKESFSANTFTVVAMVMAGFPVNEIPPAVQERIRAHRAAAREYDEALNALMATCRRTMMPAQVEREERETQERQAVMDASTHRPLTRSG